MATITKKLIEDWNGRMAMTKLEKIMKDRDVTEATKVKTAETIIFTIVTYGSEGWTVRNKERKKIDTFEIWTMGFYEYRGQT
jgi:hypothetical protein